MLRRFRWIALGCWNSWIIWGISIPTVTMSLMTMLMRLLIETIQNPNESSLSFNRLIPEALLLKPESSRIVRLRYRIWAKNAGNFRWSLTLDPDPVLLTPYSRLLLKPVPLWISFQFPVRSDLGRHSALATTNTFVPIEIPIRTDHFT